MLARGFNLRRQLARGFWPPGGTYQHTLGVYKRPWQRSIFAELNLRIPVAQKALFTEFWELVFQRDDFRSDVTTGGLGLLKSLIGGESSHHVRMSGHEDPRLMPGISSRVSMRAIVFIRLAVRPAL